MRTKLYLLTILRNLNERSKQAIASRQPRVRTIKRQYQESLTALRRSASQKSDTAIVIHLFFPETWETICSHLSVLKAREYDLYISLPHQHANFAKTIKKQYPAAQIVGLPNHGRDVLPFLTIAGLLQSLGYSYILKIHSKKSTHRTDGERWLNTILANLLPHEPKLINLLFETLAQPSTGIIGPSGEYLPLTINFEANGSHMTSILNKLYSKPQTHQTLQTNRPEFGFFAGTMFWARLDALYPILNQHYDAGYFELEKGQIDGTFAHAMERIFCLVPELNNKNLFAINAKGIKRLSYKSTNIPDWSEVYIGPNAKT